MTIKDIKVGTPFSELSTYIVEGINGNVISFKHLETNSSVKIDFSYVNGCMSSSDYFESVVKVGKKDKYYTQKQVDDIAKTGVTDLPVVGAVRVAGMESIFTNLPYKKVFTATFRKKGQELTEKQVADKKEKLVADAVALIQKTKEQKKGVAEVAKEEFKKLLDTNVESYVPGDLRTLRGYKTKQYSADGFYQVMDLEFPDSGKGKKGDDTRLVNINTLEELIVDGVKYILE